MKIDYLKEMGEARKEFYKRKIEFQDILNEWEESHEKMGRFTVGINFDAWDEVRVAFTGEANQEVIDLLCKDFNLQVAKSMKQIHFLPEPVTVRTIFILRNKDQPYYPGGG